MFESLSEKLSGILDKLTGRGALSEEDVNAAMREVRRALLEADVALEVVRSFVDRTRTKAVGAAVIKSVKPGQMVVKIVHDSLIETLGGESQAIDLNAPAPVAIMLVGLQGAGKTTTAAKIAKRLTERDRRKVLMASLDVKRPAAQEQLAAGAGSVGSNGVVGDTIGHFNGAPGLGPGEPFNLQIAAKINFKLAPAFLTTLRRICGRVFFLPILPFPTSHENCGTLHSIWRRKPRPHPTLARGVRASRVPVRVPVKVRHEGAEHEGLTRDLSSSGIFIYSESGMKAGSKLELVIMLPAGVGLGPGGWTLCEASVVRVEESDGKGIGVAATLDRIALLPEIV